MAGNGFWLPLPGSGGGGAVFSGCYLRRTTSQSIATLTESPISFNGEDFDTDGYHSLVTNPTRLTIPVGGGGYYLVNAGCSYTANVTGARQTTIYKNGLASGPRIAFNSRAGSTAGFPARVQISTGVVALVAGDYLELVAYQESGGALNVEGSATLGLTFMSIVKLG